MSNADGNSVNRSSSLCDENGCRFIGHRPAAARIPQLAPDLDRFSGFPKRKNLTDGIDDNDHTVCVMNIYQRIFKPLEEHPLPLSQCIPNPY